MSMRMILWRRISLRRYTGVRWRAMPISYSLIMCTIRKGSEKWRREGRPRTRVSGFRQRRSGSVSLSARRSPTAAGTSCTGGRLWRKRESTMPSMSFMKNRCSCTRCCSTETALKSWRKLFTATARMRWEPCAGICVR